MIDFDVRARGISDRSANLSGGNLQKFILARALSKHPKAMICAYPTRGLDIKATWFIREKIIQARDGGFSFYPVILKNYLPFPTGLWCSIGARLWGRSFRRKQRYVRWE